MKRCQARISWRSSSTGIDAVPGGIINLAHFFTQPHLADAAHLIEQDTRSLVLKNHSGATAIGGPALVRGMLYRWAPLRQA